MIVIALRRPPIVVLAAAIWTLSNASELVADADDAGRFDVFAGYIPTFQSGDVLPKEGVFAVALQPAPSVIYFTLPNGKPRLRHGGIITLEAVAAGRYRIIMTQEADLEVIQQRSFRSVRMSERRARSEGPSHFEIDVDGGPLTLQISGVTDPLIMIAVVRISDLEFVIDDR